MDEQSSLIGSEPGVLSASQIDSTKAKEDKKEAAKRKREEIMKKFQNKRHDYIEKNV